MSEINSTIISCTKLVKHFVQGKIAVQVLKGLNLELKVGHSVAIVGASGSGKKYATTSTGWTR